MLAGGAPARAMIFLFMSNLDSEQDAFTEIIEAEGHLIDSHLLERIMDKVIGHGAKFEIQRFEIGRTNEQFSHLVMKVLASQSSVLQELLVELLELGCH